MYSYRLRQRYSKKKFPVDIIQRYTFKVNTCRLTLNTFFFTVDESKLTCFTCKYQRKCVPLTTKLIWSASIKNKIKLLKNYRGWTIQRIKSLLQGWTNNIGSYLAQQSFEISITKCWHIHYMARYYRSVIFSTTKFLKLEIARFLEPVKFTHLYMNVSRQVGYNVKGIVEYLNLSI